MFITAAQFAVSGKRTAWPRITARLNGVTVQENLELYRHTDRAQQKPLIDAVTATPVELATHIREALEWTKANRDINPANAFIIYGWNESDEGGWLVPTLGTDGKPDEART